VSVVATLARLVAAGSQNPGGDERALATLLAGELRARGADRVQIVEAARKTGPGTSVLAIYGTPRLLVNAHLDTVPMSTGWSSDPFIARVGHDRVTGLGAADIKGAIAAILCALDEARPRDTAVLFSGDEEAENKCMRGLIESKVLPLGAGGIERAIVCEPTQLRVGTRHRGIVSFEIERTGEGGHSSRADQLVKPIAELARVGVALDDWARALASVGPAGYEGSCLNLAALDGGVAFNVIPTRAVLRGSLRPAPGTDVPRLRRGLDAIVTRVAPEAQMRWGLDNAPFATRERERFRDLLGARIDTPVDLGFWTEAALLSAAGVDAVVIGPGDIKHAHAPDEWVAIAELEAAQHMFADIFRRPRGAG
jgi:acetylornithine deacetylase